MVLGDTGELSVPTGLGVSEGGQIGGVQESSVTPRVHEWGVIRHTHI